MDLAGTATLDDVKQVLIATLGIEDRAATLDASTPLFGGLPELDSMAVVELVVALEQRFGLTINDDEVTSEVFESLGSLTAFIDAKRRDPPCPRPEVRSRKSRPGRVRRRAAEETRRGQGDDVVQQPARQECEQQSRREHRDRCHGRVERTGELHDRA